MTDLTTILEIADLPFHIGPQRKPSNPEGIPQTLAFRLAVDKGTGHLRQVPDPSVSAVLDSVYASGSLIGSAMDESPIGNSYALDFLSFIKESIGRPLAGVRILEIGAGRGYLMSLMKSEGADVVGLEPGGSNKPYWEKYHVDIIADYFPSDRIRGNFDAIVAYGVCEHIVDLQQFLMRVRDQLRPGAVFIASVPDCTLHLESGDPSMLLHEHWHYFTQRTAAAMYVGSGLRPNCMRPAGYGGAIYSSALPGEFSTFAPDGEYNESVSKYALRVTELRNYFAKRLASRDSGDFGAYCPSRAINLLPADSGPRLFDDDPNLQGTYFPPFASPVESFARLLQRPVKELWILSRTFGPALSQKLRRDSRLAGCDIQCLHEVPAWV